MASSLKQLRKELAKQARPCVYVVPSLLGKKALAPWASNLCGLPMCLAARARASSPCPPARAQNTSRSTPASANTGHATGRQWRGILTDTIKTTKVIYSGVVPDLFREGQGAVAEGTMQADGTFLADSVLAKHDEKYMPKELASSLKAKGVKLGLKKAYTDGTVAVDMEVP